MNGGEILIQASGLYKSFRKVKAVQGVDFTLGKGEYVERPHLWR